MIRDNYTYFTSLMNVNYDKFTCNISRIASVVLFRGGNVFNRRPHGITSRITYSSIIVREDASRRTGLFSLSLSLSSMKGHGGCLKYQ